MKYILIVASFFIGMSAQAINLVVRPVEVVEEKTKKEDDIKIPLPAKKEKIVLERGDWKCQAQSVSNNWGAFSCKNSEGLEVSTRFNCDEQKSFEQHQGFRIAKKGVINLTLSIWCE